MKKVIVTTLLVVLILSITLPAFARAFPCPYCDRPGYIVSRRVYLSTNVQYNASGTQWRFVYTYENYKECTLCKYKWDYVDEYVYGPWNWDD